MQVLLCPLEVLSRLMMVINESEEDSELSGIQVYLAYQSKAIFSLLSVFTLCEKVKEFKLLKGLFWPESQWKTQCAKQERNFGESRAFWAKICDAEWQRQDSTNPGGFKLTTWQPRLWKNATAPALGRTLNVANIRIQDLELLKVSIVYRLLQLLSCNLSKSRNRPLQHQPSSLPSRLHSSANIFK